MMLDMQKLMENWKPFWFGVLLGAAVMRVLAGPPFSDAPTLLWCIAAPMLLDLPGWLRGFQRLHNGWTDAKQ